MPLATLTKPRFQLVDSRNVTNHHLLEFRNFCRLTTKKYHKPLLAMCKGIHLIPVDSFHKDLVIWKVRPWASYQIRKIAGCTCAGNAGNVPGIPGACATHNFTYLARGPCNDASLFLRTQSLQTLAQVVIAPSDVIALHLAPFNVAQPFVLQWTWTFLFK